jgi:hypothetical protein
MRRCVCTAQFTCTPHMRMCRMFACVVCACNRVHTCARDRVFRDESDDVIHWLARHQLVRLSSQLSNTNTATTTRTRAQARTRARACMAWDANGSLPMNMNTLSINTRTNTIVDTLQAHLNTNQPPQVEKGVRNTEKGVRTKEGRQQQRAGVLCSTRRHLPSLDEKASASSSAAGTGSESKSVCNVATLCSSTANIPAYTTPPLECHVTTRPVSCRSRAATTCCYDVLLRRAAMTGSNIGQPAPQLSEAPTN